MKKCPKCKKKLPNKSFARRDAGRMCKRCKCAYSRIWYRANAEKQKAAARANTLRYRKRNLEVINRLKNMPCVDCETKYPLCVMQFDHLPEKGKKLFCISNQALNGGNLEELKAELAKCEVVCANCHCIRTVKRRACSTTDSVGPS